MEVKFSATGTSSYSVSSGATYYAHLYGTWYAAAGSIITSARSAKYDLQSYSDAYNTLFDALKPTTFRYVQGESHRIHQGFILDEVADAVRAAVLSLDDFGAYCLTDPDDPTVGGLRYEEFISLNTWQIQLLKPRVSDLELRCQQLEARVQELEARLNDLS